MRQATRTTKREQFPQVEIWVMTRFSVERREVMMLLPNTSRVVQCDEHMRRRRRRRCWQ